MMGEAERLVFPAIAPAESARPAVALASRRRSLGPPIEAKLRGPTARREWVPRPELVGYLGAVSAGRGRLTEAREELERALHMRRRHPGISSWPTLEVLLRLAPVLLETGERSRAVTLIAEARLLLASSPDGAGAQLARLGQVERRLAGEPQGMPVIDPLTDREVTVLRLLGGSMPMREIAQELYVSPNTVKIHTRAIYRKLGVSTRHDAINTLQITPVDEDIPGGAVWS